MEQEKTLVINTKALFNALNTNRKSKNLAGIEHSLIANKLGILFTLKAGCYVNFKHDSVKLQKSQWSILQEIFNQHFNVDLFTEIHTLVVPPPPIPTQRVTPVHPQSHTVILKTSFIGKIKAFLEKTIYSLDEPVIENACYLIDVELLFREINQLRQEQHLNGVEDVLIANKLGILFALKTNSYVCFKQKWVELPENSLTVLQAVIEQHFNVVVNIESIVPKQNLMKKVSAHSPDLATAPRVKNFFRKRRARVTEMLEGML
jgi:hypothetical protein